MVLLVLVGVELGELSDRLVEGRTLAEVGGDGDAVTRASVRPGQRPSTYLRVDLQRRRAHHVDVGGGLGVPELSDVEVPGLTVDPFGPHPAEEDVAGGLHQSLALHDPSTVVVELALPDERLEHGRFGLLGLEEQRVLAIAASEEEDPGPGADAADADRLAAEVDELEPVEQSHPVVRKGPAVLAQEWSERGSH